MRALLFSFVLLLTSCARDLGTVVEQLFPTDMTPEAFLTISMVSDTSLVEVKVDLDTLIPVKRQLYQTPCAAVFAKLDGADGTSPKPYHYVDCANLPGPWNAGFVWVLVEHKDSYEWVRCPALLRPGAVDIVRVKKISVLTNPDRYAADLLVQAD